MSDPIQPELFEVMNRVGKLLSDNFKPFGFALLVFPFGYKEGNRMNYISNACREDMISSMKEFIARAEGRHQEHNTEQ